MAKELPGFYYDAEKNRYFPCRRPIPGSRPPVSPLPDPKEDATLPEGVGTTQQRLLYARELCGNVIVSRRRKLSFQSECEKKLAKKPVILKCTKTGKIGSAALEHIVADVVTPDGSKEIDILLSAGVNGLISIQQVGKPQTEIIAEQSRLVDPLLSADGLQHGTIHRGVTTRLQSEVSSLIQLFRKGSQPVDTTSKHVVITTMGSESDPGSVWILNLNKPLTFNAFPWEGNCVYKYKGTLWTADSDNAGKNISIGTNRGVGLLNIETGNQSWVLRSKSDVLSLQYGTSGRVILSGLRNGSILSLDPRRKQVSSKYCSVAAMPSSVCCLSLLHLWDQYFLASSMDGTIRLYDHRLMKRGPVQSYDGNVNSHTRIHLGVDPSEKVVLSGGEDCHVRLWDIKSGELLFNKRLMDEVASAVCWPKLDGNSMSGYWEKHTWGVWLGSYEGIYYMDWL